MICLDCLCVPYFLNYAIAAGIKSMMYLYIPCNCTIDVAYTEHSKRMHPNWSSGPNTQVCPVLWLVRRSVFSLPVALDEATPHTGYQFLGPELSSHSSGGLSMDDDSLIHRCNGLENSKAYNVARIRHSSCGRRGHWHAHRSTSKLAKTISPRIAWCLAI